MTSRDARIPKDTEADHARKIANGEDYVVTPTAEDPDIFNELTPFILKVVGK